MTQPSDPSQRARRAYEDAEKRTSSVMEQLVSSQAFAEALSLFTSNLVAASKVATIGVDQVVRATRLAGRGDIARLGRQLGRTEDKLEQVLQHVERLEDELAEARAERDALAEAAEAEAIVEAAEADGEARATRSRSAGGRSRGPRAERAVDGDGAPRAKRPARAPRTTSAALFADESDAGRGERR